MIFIFFGDSPASATSPRRSLIRWLSDTPNIIPPQKLNVVDVLASRSSRYCAVFRPYLDARSSGTYR
jgi:hypothetical protein